MKDMATKTPIFVGHRRTQLVKPVELPKCWALQRQNSFIIRQAGISRRALRYPGWFKEIDEERGGIFGFDGQGKGRDCLS